MNNRAILEEAEKALLPIFSEIDAKVKQNLKKILSAFRLHRVGVHHFASVSGYGHDDLGRETLDKVFAEVMGAQTALVRVQFVSGTHAIACALFGILRPGDEMLSVAGSPYDTLEEVIGLRGNCQGSLKEFNIDYREVPLLDSGTLDWATLKTVIKDNTRLVLIQRSCGYSWRKSLSIAEIEEIIAVIKQQNSNTVCLVDNCYGEFIETIEPTAVGADLMAGSLIKNPGGTLVTAGGYVAGQKELVEMAACRLTAPGIGTEGGATFNQNRLLFQGLFLAPQLVGEAVKGSHLIAYVFNKLGYPVNPLPLVSRRDVIQAIQLGSPEKLTAFCKAIQGCSPVGSYLSPVPATMPGYESQLVMAGGTFVDGSTSELSADGPLREPYIVFCQGGTHWTHISIALEAALEAII
ncbi:MAG: aminotransferase class I/II-fold pyridoxal phosphate-dependent enzyme [cyanobacterium endosymbiont of Rhopalodia musculus]|uniref:methionine gamma-lyase family protein n=1 Tax=cyanobacterium endosymbiont of Epithemia clementina EcSB TaxID=3034674 RepID=UPI002480FA3A|nr:methionine gamma-lyase family protein [cyanobacterium endosymbiont of Epithemia clementina EcSB]WGT67257.1 methionine gamma-lyase family protein [cyanobacterium endosymbiont of Epithemia clementina EcSB]